MKPTAYYLGLDVSMNSTGWAVLSYSEGRVRYVDSGVIKVKTNKSHGQRLREQREKFEGILKTYPIHYAAREAGFSRHIKATQVLFKAYGVAEEFFADLHLVEIASTTIKKIVTGNGRASKEEVEKAIRKRLELPKDFVFKNDDESDAIGVALALINQVEGAS